MGLFIRFSVPSRSIYLPLALCLLFTPFLALPSHAQTSTSAPAAAVPVTRFQLANGLTVIVKTDRRAPTAAHMLWVRVGSMDEVDGTSGVAHVLEHMMFKGTADLKPGEFSVAWPRWGAARMPSPHVTPPVFTSRFRPTSLRT